MAEDGLRLVKMHGCGNDYVFVDTIGGPGLPEDVDLSLLAREVSDRNFGVGGDGMIIISRSATGRMAMRMFNADGSESEMCGNGLRCLARYCYEEGYTDGPRFEVETLAGLMVPEIRPAAGPARRAAGITVNLGTPRKVRPGLEITLASGAAAGTYRGTRVSMGNPHFVIFTGNLQSVDVEVAGAALEVHPLFPERTNVEFVEARPEGSLRMRVWERGSGLTLACGTGAAAAVVAAVGEGRAQRDRPIEVIVDGGRLEVEWTRAGPVLVTGPAVEVFRTAYNHPLPRRGEAAGTSRPGSEGPAG